MRSKLKEMAAYLVIIYVFPVFCLAAVLSRHLSRGTPIPLFMRDPQVLGGIHPLAGVISNLGVLIMAAGASVLFFSCFILWRLKKENDVLFFFFFAAVLTSIFMADDLFMLHDSLFKVYFGLGEVYSYAAYVILFLLGCLFFRRQLLETDWFLLIIALGCWSASVLVDMGDHFIERYIGENYRILIEDGMKYFGIVTWVGYFAGISYRRLVETMYEKKSGEV